MSVWVSLFGGVSITIRLYPGAQMLQAFARCKEIGAIAQVHAENGDLIAVVSFSQN